MGVSTEVPVPNSVPNQRTNDLFCEEGVGFPDGSPDMLTNMMTLNTPHPVIQNLPTNIFDGLTNLQSINLSSGFMQNLQHDVFDETPDMVGDQFDTRMNPLVESIASWANWLAVRVMSYGERLTSFV